MVPRPEMPIAASLPSRHVRPAGTTAPSSSSAGKPPTKPCGAGFQNHWHSSSLGILLVVYGQMLDALPAASIHLDLAPPSDAAPGFAEIGPDAVIATF